MKRVSKKGISPVIATVLLVGMVVVIGLIIFIWFRGIVGESATKFGKNIKLVCEDVNFDASYSSSNKYLSVVNIGNVPIFQLRLRYEEEGKHTTGEIDHTTTGWSVTGLGQGGTFNGEIGPPTGTKKIIVFPVLIGTSDRGRKTYICEGQYGKEIRL